MKSQTRVVVIGGGIAGCSTLYHLTREGWSDVMLLERDELTSGTTWHSAAQVTNFGAVQTMVGLKSHSIRLYMELAADPEHPITYHHGDGGIRLASTTAHLDGYRHFVSMAKGMGVEFEVIDAAECRRRHPLIATDNLAGALWDPLDGDIDPAGLCQALVRRARAAGAEVHRQTPVTGLAQKANGEWIVTTPRGDIVAEHVVNACGYRVNEVGAMMGVSHPVVSMEHQYFLTEPIAEIAALGHRVPLIRCPTDDFYSRQEKHGLLVGFYEQGCKTWGLDGIDPHFTSALCPSDPDRVMDLLEGAMRRLPCLSEAGIHTIINGPITYSPDGLPLVGRIPERRNAWCIIGLRAGIGEGGGHGWLLAQQIVHGKACYDTWCLDPRRFTSHCTTEYTALKAIEDYRNEFRFHMPHEYRPAGRPAKVTPLTPLLEARGAVFGTVNGWERALFFAPSPDFVDEHSFRFTPTRAVVANEVAAVRDAVGVMEVDGFTRFEVAGEGAAGWLDGLYTSPLPKEGKVALTYSVTPCGHLLSEVTVARIAADRFWLGSAAAAEWHDRDWLSKRLPASGVRLANLTATHTILVVAGPRSRELLQSVSPRTDWSKAAFPWLGVREVLIGPHRVVVMSVSYSGELAFELHVPLESAIGVHRLIEDSGKPLGLRHFGLYAAESMRLEKGYRHWKADIFDEFDPFEAGLSRFVRLEKGGFEGRDALAERKGRPPRRKFIVLTLDSDVAPAHGGDSILADGQVVGSVTSAGWGHRTGMNIAFGYVDPEHAELGTKLSVEVLGERVPASVAPECLYDPRNDRVRA
ncbi:MAG: FAD-dependent oxidoreductase [Rhizobiales bacterium]|nr:FAD-dependent oxidoreductase [Hyphomicrobiales bacterium]